MKFRTIVSALCYFCWFFLAWAYWLRPDSLTALTIAPAWIWVPTGLVLASLASWKDKRQLLAHWSLGLLFLLSFSEEAYSVLPSRVESEGNRIVSLNWGGAGRAAFPDVLALKPSVLFVQEAPRKELLEELAEELGLEFLWTPEAAILASGELSEIARSVHHVHAKWRDIDLVSLRLRPPLARFDLWSPSCWRAYAERRRERRGQVEVFLPNLGLSSIVAGDFNVPAGDGALDSLASKLQDCYSSSDGEFCNTAPSFLPLHRIDQVWMTDKKQVLGSWTKEIKGSDHRAVIVELSSSAEGLFQSSP